MNKGDADKIKSVFAPSNPTEVKMVDAVLAQQSTMMKFHAAAVTAFGADEAKKLPPGDVDAAIAESLLALDKFPESITGDTATVGEGDQLLHLKKQGEKWILPVSLLAPQITADNVDQQLAKMGEQGKLLADMTDEIGKGKYKTADDAGKALQLKAMQQIMAHQGAASQPAVPCANPRPNSRATRSWRPIKWRRSLARGLICFIPSLLSLPRINAARADAIGRSSLSLATEHPILSVEGQKMSVEQFVQTLESRRLFAIAVAGGTLTITGGTGVDVVQVDTSGTFIIATLGKTTKKFACSTISRISVNVLAGNDFVSLGRITVPGDDSRRRWQ